MVIEGLQYPEKAEAGREIKQASAALITAPRVQGLITTTRSGNPERLDRELATCPKPQSHNT